MTPLRSAGWSCRLVLVLLAAASARTLGAQDKAKDYVVGEAVAVDAASRRLTVKPDAGEPVVVTVDEHAVLLRAQPGAKSLAGASPLELPQIAAGDRVMVRGALSEDRTLLARQVVVMTRDDVAKKQDAEQADWRRRGVLGVVTAIDTGSGQVTLKAGRAADAPSLTLATAGRDVSFRRYAPDSVRFSDARPSSLGEIQVGDEVRAVGERDANGVVLAEQVVSGSFRVVSGVIQSVDAQRASLVVRDDESQSDVTVAVGPDARVRRLPPEVAARLARRTGNAGAERHEAGSRPDGLAHGEAGPRAERPGSRPEELLERLPATTLAELKPGDRVLVSSTKGESSARANAIALLAGIEGLMTAAPSRRAGRALDLGLPPELMDLGLSIP